MSDQIGIDQGQLARIEAVERDLKAETGRSEIQALGHVTEKFEQLVTKALADIGEASKFLGLDPEEARSLRRGIETVDGGLDGIRAVLPYALRAGGVAGLAIAGGGALVGALGGSGREAARRASEGIRMRDEDELNTIISNSKEGIERVNREHAERKAAFRRAAGIR